MESCLQPRSPLTFLLFRVLASARLGAVVGGCPGGVLIYVLSCVRTGAPSLLISSDWLVTSSCAVLYCTKSGGDGGGGVTGYFLG